MGWVQFGWLLMANKTLLVVPCYNEERRLNFAEFEKWASEDLQFLFFDDGSTDETASLISQYIENRPFMYFEKGVKNLGKAEAVRSGVLTAKNLPVYGRLDWIGFWDADLATPLFEVSNMFTYADFCNQPVDAVFGSRVFRLGARIERLPYRHYLARVFATLVSVMLGVRSYDSQCGAKLFKKSVAERAFSKHFVSRWIFDVEILLRLDQSRIVEYPLTRWVDVAGSKLRPKDVITVFTDILRIWRKKS